MNITVIAGGTSTERDISIVSGRMICESLRRNGHKANMIDVFLGSDEYENSEAFFNADNDLAKLADELKAKTKSVVDEAARREENREAFFGKNVLDYCKAADIVFMGLHGANGEDGKVQATFDLLGIRYTGTGYLSSAISMDKQLTKTVLLMNDVPMPKGITLRKGHKIEYVPFPCVVKPCCGGSSVGVSIVNKEEDFKQALDLAFSLEDQIMVEEYVKGREFSVAVIDGKALPVIEIEPLEGFYDYKNKYSGNTKETCPADITEEESKKMQSIAVRACNAVGIETYSRVDILMREDSEMYVLEINSLPGMTPTSLIPQEAAAIGVSYDELTEKIIKCSMDKYNN